jgi:hypothetical protein
MIVERLQTARRATVRHALAAERAGFASHEQALTEVVLTRAAPAVQVSTFSQREEARTGADWLWWWRGRGEWFGALVQAKRNKPLHSRPWCRAPRSLVMVVSLMVGTGFGRGGLLAVMGAGGWGPVLVGGDFGGGRSGGGLIDDLFAGDRSGDERLDCEVVHRSWEAA